MDFMKKKLEQQHEEELERKDAIKKQLERKVTFPSKRTVAVCDPKFWPRKFWPRNFVSQAYQM